MINMINRNKNKILIVNDGQDCGHPYAPLFGPLGEVSHDIPSFKLNAFRYKLIVFTGGSDVSPNYYGDSSPKKICHVNSTRDAEEYQLFKFARQRGIKMTGICRGMQFLNVMTGGKLVHDLSGHGRSHLTAVKDCDKPFLTNSFHHQMCIPHSDTDILAWSHEKLSNAYIGDKDELIDYKGLEVESIYNRVDRVLGVQWHPEATMNSGDSAKGRQWYTQMIKDWLAVTPNSFANLYLGLKGSQLKVVEHG
jgi:gamma-glutamyl-gamma-aminobutyrate hydrolase PuuD